MEKYYYYGIGGKKMAGTLQQFTGEEVISTDLVPKLNNNFNYLNANFGGMKFEIDSEDGGLNIIVE